jgi:hypothetical protein
MARDVRRSPPGAVSRSAGRPVGLRRAPGAQQRPRPAADLAQRAQPASYCCLISPLRPALASVAINSAQAVSSKGSTRTSSRA